MLFRELLLISSARRPNKLKWSYPLGIFRVIVVPFTVVYVEAIELATSTSVPNTKLYPLMEGSDTSNVCKLSFGVR